jgi:hypothetical protein
LPSPSVGQARQGSTSATPRSPRGLKCCRDLIDAAGRRRAVRVSSSDPPCPFRNACGVHPRKIRMASSIRSPILWRVSCVTASTAPYRGVSVSSSSSSSSSGSLIHFHLYHLQRFVTGGGRVSTHSLVSRDLALLGKPDESAGGKETYYRRKRDLPQRRIYTKSKPDDIAGGIRDTYVQAILLHTHCIPPAQEKKTFPSSQAHKQTTDACRAQNEDLSTNRISIYMSSFLMKKKTWWAHGMIITSLAPSPVLTPQHTHTHTQHTHTPAQ